MDYAIRGSGREFIIRQEEYVLVDSVASGNVSLESSNEGCTVGRARAGNLDGLAASI